MQSRSRLFLFIAILLLAFPALVLACEGEEPADSTPVDGSRPTEVAGTSAGGAAKGRFASVSAGEQYTCAVRADGSVSCWGDDFGRGTPPKGGSPPSARGTSTLAV